MNNTIYLVNCTSLQNQTLFTQGLSFISKDRQEEIKKLNFKNDQILSMGVGLLIAYSIQTLNLRGFVYHKNEKPFFSDPNINISISHAGDYAMVGFSKEPLGVDVEHINQQYEAVLRRFYQEKEKEYVLSASNQDRAFYELWSRKESYIKRNCSTDIRTFSVLEPQEGMEYRTYEIDDYSCVCYVSKNYPTDFKILTIQEILETLK